MTDDMPLVIRDAALADRTQWALLWKGYQEFYKVDLPEPTTDTTWKRFFDAAEPVHCMVAEKDGELVGLVHYIFHRNTWMAGPVCYLQDLFTSTAARGHGVGRALIEAVYAKAREAGASRVYWTTHETTAQAMILYDKVAEKSGFLQYRKQV
jgi:GNAT superfamily N-acetyltransferase